VLLPPPVVEADGLFVKNGDVVEAELDDVDDMAGGRGEGVSEVSNVLPCGV